jgi:hypothetical protein
MTALRFCAAAGLAALTVFVCAHSARLDRAVAAQDASATWNTYCAAYEFPQCLPATPTGWTFTDAWNSVSPHHLTFAGALAALQSQVSSALGVENPGHDGDDLFAASVRNWPSS